MPINRRISLPKSGNVVLITLLFVLGNWSVTTLMDGEGSLKDIYMVIGYASLPLSIIRIPLALLTNLLSFAEKGGMSTRSWPSPGRCFFVLLFLGVLVVHQYTVFKTVVTTVLDPAGHRNYDFYRLCLYLPGLADGGLCVAHRQGTAAAAVKPKLCGIPRRV